MNLRRLARSASTWLFRPLTRVITWLMDAPATGAVPLTCFLYRAGAAKAEPKVKAPATMAENFIVMVVGC